MRNNQLYTRHRAGESANDLALEYGISARQLWEILSQMKARLVAEKYRKAMKRKG